MEMGPPSERSFSIAKAFDLIDHRILVRKLRSLDLPVSIINWIIDFLSNRFQREGRLCVRMGFGSLRGPSGHSKLGPLAFYHND